jgi:hypothetical protein
MSIGRTAGAPKVFRAPVWPPESAALLAPLTRLRILEACELGVLLLLLLSSPEADVDASPAALLLLLRCCCVFCLEGRRLLLCHDAEAPITSGASMWVLLLRSSRLLPICAAAVAAPAALFTGVE